MAVLETIYDDSFFREYGRQNLAYRRACFFIAKEIAKRFQPKTVVDWGCGGALHAEAFLECGIDVIAVDGVRPTEEFRSPKVDIRIADIAVPVRSDLVFPSYDLSLCCDVIEHIYESDSAAALENITRGAELVILSAAPIGQGGHHHVNEQPRRYWIKRMDEIGWCYNRRETGSLENYFQTKRHILTESWMYHNLCIYRPK